MKSGLFSNKNNKNNENNQLIVTRKSGPGDDLPPYIPRTIGIARHGYQNLSSEA